MTFQVIHNIDNSGQSYDKFHGRSEIVLKRSHLNTRQAQQLFQISYSRFDRIVQERRSQKQDVESFGYGDFNERRKKLIQHDHTHDMVKAEILFQKNPKKKNAMVVVKRKYQNKIDFILTNKIGTVKDLNVNKMKDEFIYQSKTGKAQECQKTDDDQQKHMSSQSVAIKKRTEKK